MKRVLLVVLAALLLAAGIGHFVIPDRFMAIMPPYLPWHYELVLITGVLEIAGGLGLLIPRTRKAAAWGCSGCCWRCGRPTSTTRWRRCRSRGCRRRRQRCGCACRCSWCCWRGRGGTRAIHRRSRSGNTNSRAVTSG
ncbi:DoxX family protein [Nannocystis pusilla]|uniref:DoxX family protein n=1 Tax=Nannocystis pusilla TaxID=889268 RepID=UPI003B80B8F6